MIQNRLKYSFLIILDSIIWNKLVCFTFEETRFFGQIAWTVIKSDSLYFVDLYSVSTLLFFQTTCLSHSRKAEGIS